MRRRRHKSTEEGTSYWLSYSDMMAALLLIFVLIITLTILKAKIQYDVMKGELEETKEKIDKIIGIRARLIEDLRDEFDRSDLTIDIDSHTGAIMFESKILFDPGESELKEEGKIFLDAFLPSYFRVLLRDDYKKYISEIIIEGHTDSRSGYIYNLQLSQERALAVALYCIDENTSKMPHDMIDDLKDNVTANGRSYSNLIKNPDGTENMEASRRVEFKFRLKEDEMVEEMLKILNEDK